MLFMTSSSGSYLYNLANHKTTLGLYSVQVEHKIKRFFTCSIRWQHQPTANLSKKNNTSKNNNSERKRNEIGTEAGNTTTATTARPAMTTTTRMKSE